MQRRSLNARSIHARESYIAISSYVRSVHIQRPNRRFFCPRGRPCQYDSSTIHSHQFSILTNLKDHSRVTRNEDVTQGFPEPPGLGLAPSTSERNRNAEAPTPHQSSGQSLPPDHAPGSSAGTILPDRNKSSDSEKNDSTARPQEDLTGAECGHDKRSCTQHLSRRYQYMGEVLHHTHAVYVPISYE
jgi:hypothetical protein